MACYDFMIAVKLKKRFVSTNQGIKDSTIQVIDNIANRALNWLSVEANITEKDFEKFSPPIWQENP